MFKFAQKIKLPRAAVVFPDKPLNCAAFPEAISIEIVSLQANSIKRIQANRGKMVWL